MYPLFETIKILDGAPQYLLWHQKRLDRSLAEFYGKTNKIVLAEQIIVPEEFGKGLVKCRFNYNDRTGFAEFSSYIPRNTCTLRLVDGGEITYSMKYSDRNVLEKLLQQKGNYDDILIVKNNRISDTSYTNIVLFNGIEWHTPLHPLLEGSQRNRLIFEGKIMVSDICIKDLSAYKSFKLINAMMDFAEQQEVKIENIGF